MRHIAQFIFYLIALILPILFISIIFQLVFDKSKPEISGKIAKVVYILITLLFISVLFLIFYLLYTILGGHV